MITYENDTVGSMPAEAEMVDIESLVKAKLLPLPGSAVRLLELLQNPDVSTGHLAEVIGYDPVLASRVMRLANSPIYAMERNISSVSGAVSAIGLRSIYDIVMLGVAADSFSTDMRSMKTGVSIWEHSVAAALACRAIATELKLRGADEAFTCGLLHDIGKNLLYQSDPNRYTEIEFADDEEAASEMERRMFGFDHSQVGFYVAKRWSLSDDVTSTLLWHHNPARASQAIATCHIVNVADDLVTRKGMGLHIGDPETLPLSESVIKLGLVPEQLDRAWEFAETRLKDILNNF